ncbi:MAG: DNA adenine methylase [Candidatus Aenigmarchaeota archaeon]|nr:DNA adenine methylase [Candidatus Aenigmarchaeota archaeon]
MKKKDNERFDAPSTRYQGSKRRMVSWLKNILVTLEFETVLDAFGGSGSIGFLFKSMGKEVSFNDILKSNSQTGIALIENKNVKLNVKDIEFIFNERKTESYPKLISKMYNGIYFLDEENILLDKMIKNIEDLSLLYNGKTLRYKKALAYHNLFQSCLSKRPFNLFHRKNLNLRTSNVKRSFGNKKTWDKPFKDHFIKFNKEYSKFVFDNGKNNMVLNTDIFNINDKFDLVYFDPPYCRKDSCHPQNYAEMYHFLEGIMNYNTWEHNIDNSRVNKPFIFKKNTWDCNLISNFDNLFRKFSDSTIVVSYGNKGKPTIQTIVKLMKKYKKTVITKSIPYSYKLNRNNGKGYREVIIIGK